MADPYATSVTMLLNFEGNPSLPGFINDYSLYRNPVKIYGACASMASDKKYGSFGGGFNVNSEASGYVGLPTAGVCDFGTGDYTVEGWSKVNINFDYNVLFCSQSTNSAGNVNVTVTGAGAISHGFYDGASRPGVISANGAITPGTWFHWRATRASGMCYLFLNGGPVGTPITVNLSIGSADPRVGMNPALGTQRLIGLMDDFVITKGIARSTSAFTPPDQYDYTPDPAFSVSRLRSPMPLSSYPMPAKTTRRLKSVLANSAFKSVGAGTIIATTKEKAVPNDLPVSRRVVLHRHADGQPVAETWSDAAGNYAFTNIDPRLKYYAVSFDHTGHYRGVIADNLTPEVI